MSEDQMSLENRINSCRDLLDVFRREREQLLSKERLEPSHVVKTLKLKLRLVNCVSEDLTALRQVEQVQQKESCRQQHRQEQIRELGDLLEKLLVIERENQLLLRNLIDADVAAETASPSAKHAQQSEPETSAENAVPLMSRLKRIRSDRNALLG